MVLYRCIALITLSFLPAIALSQVFSWKDENGKIHYGDRPPASKQSNPRKLAAPPPVDTEANRKTVLEGQFAEREKQQKSQEEAKKSQEDQAQAKEREAGCQQARSNLAALESGEVRFTVDAKGERIALEGVVRDAEIAKARKAVDSWCSPPPKPTAK
ncbi:MAG: DUF4124 domain-containing protein [Rhodocyclaceae bacterium]|nr:DUF4124 domain-containing protein [Rhodocyclaceae bacterium]MDZ4215416.1 DUF4124 domain-containing protein [Rhodocyclaceae bacterium]